MVDIQVFLFHFFSVISFVASAVLKQHRNIVGLQSVAYKGFVLLLSFSKNPAIPNFLILKKRCRLKHSSYISLILLFLCTLPPISETEKSEFKEESRIIHLEYKDKKLNMHTV